MIGITSSLTSQSPAWIAATLHGTLSQRTDPVRRITGNPTHKERPTCTAPIQLLTPSSATRRAITQARTKHRTNSMSRSEEHTSELQSLAYLVCRLLLEKKK